MPDEDLISCSCGASGDIGELTEHVLSKMNGGASADEHQILDAPEPQPIIDEREKAARRDEILVKLATLLEATPEEVRDVLRL